MIVPEGYPILFHLFIVFSIWFGLIPFVIVGMHMKLKPWTFSDKPRRGRRRRRSEWDEAVEHAWFVGVFWPFVLFYNIFWFPKRVIIWIFNFVPKTLESIAKWFVEN